MSRSSEIAVIFTPLGRDASVAAAILAEAGMAATISPSLPAFVAALKAGAGFAIVTEEALRDSDLRELARFIAEQPEWSDVPIILLTERGGGLERNPGAGRMNEALGNVTFLERPFHPTTLVSLSRSALRARRRQYQARAGLETIRQGEERLRLALKAGSLGAWVLETPSLALHVSDQGKAHYGRRPDEAFGYRDLIACIHPDDWAVVRARMRATLEGGEDYDVEYRCLWPDGSEHWLHVRGALDIPTAADATAAAAADQRAQRRRRFSGITQEITARKAAERELAALAATLEDRVAAATAKLKASQEHLLQSQKLETIGQLTGGVAHDFNNLLTPIVGSLDLLRRKLADDERAQMMASAGLQSAERAKLLVSRLLSFARRQTLEPRPVDVGGLVHGMRELIERSIGPTIAVQVTAADDLPAAQVDPNQLELSILNLVVNARDAMPSGGRIAIAAGLDTVSEPHVADLSPGPYVRLSVADTGVGMDAATAKRAVEPFYTTKGVGEGTGLGLSMVHGLMAQLGGGMAIDSEPGRGTRVSLWLPALDERAAAPGPAAYDGVGDGDGVGAPMARPTRRLRILLVDDEPLVRFATADMLRDAGYEVVEAASAAEARERVRAGLAPDVLVTDHLMPGGRGTDLASGLCEALPHLKVLVATGYADMPDIRYPRIAKPFGAAELVERVRALVEVA